MLSSCSIMFVGFWVIVFEPHVTLVSEVAMAHHDSLRCLKSKPYQTISREPGCASNRLVAKAKEWDDSRQVAILPTLLRGRLIDYYTEIPPLTKANLKRLKVVLQKKGGLAGDPFTASLAFSTRKQKKDEQAEDFTSDLAKLTKLFKQLAYPKEHLSSSVLLQQFVTGLCSPISHQILFRVRPCDLDFQAATESASEVEQAFSLHPIKEDRIWPCYCCGGQKAVQTATLPTNPQMLVLHKPLKTVTQRLESLELKIQQQPPTHVPDQQCHWHFQALPICAHTCIVLSVPVISVDKYVICNGIVI